MNLGLTRSGKDKVRWSRKQTLPPGGKSPSRCTPKPEDLPEYVASG